MSFIIKRVAKKIRRSINRKDNKLTEWTRGFTGMLPDFLIVGVPKGGTTSLFKYLIQHPCVHAPARKEVGYFDRRYGKGIRWYRAQFPSFIRKNLHMQIRGHQCFISGEASTGYILYPHALVKMKQTLPDAKVILLLRNPAASAYSHYQNSVSIGRKSLSFRDALERARENWLGLETVGER